MILLLLRFRRHIDAIRNKSAVSPYAFMWITLALSALAIPTGYLSSFAQGANLPGATHFSVWSLVVIDWVASLVGILYVGGMVSWGLRRQAQKKSWGVQLPGEVDVWMFRPGVWAGLAVGMFYQALILALGAALWLLLHLKVGLALAGVSGVVGTVYTIQAITIFYRIPKITYLWMVVFRPLIIISVLGILLAVVLGQVHNYDEAAKRHAAVASAGIRPMAGAAPGVQATPMQTSPVGETAHVRSLPKTTPPLSPIEPEPQVFRSTPARDLAFFDQHCIGGRPMKLPQQSEWRHAGTVTAFVPRRAVISTMFETQKTVHGFLEGKYLAGQRVLVHPSGAGPDVRFMVVVPAGMSVQVGQKVEMAGAHASRHMPCQYVPNLLIIAG